MVAACRSRSDVVIAVDASSSVGEDDFQTALDFVRDVVSSLDIDGGNNRVSVLSFSDSVDVRFHLDDYSSYTDISNAISMHFRYTSYIKGMEPAAGAFTGTRDSWPLQDGIKDSSSLHPVTIPICLTCRALVITLFMLRRVRNCRRYYCYYYYILYLSADIYLFLNGDENYRCRILITRESIVSLFPLQISLTFSRDCSYTINIAI